MAASKWELLGFMNALREWMRRDPPPGPLLVKAAQFGAVLEQNPEDQAEREHDNLLLRLMPGTEHDGHIVSITFEVTDRRVVLCQDVACVPYPQGELLLGWPPPPHH